MFRCFFCSLQERIAAERKAELNKKIKGWDPERFIFLFCSAGPFAILSLTRLRTLASKARGAAQDLGPFPGNGAMVLVVKALNTESHSQELKVAIEDGHNWVNKVANSYTPQFF